MLNVRGRGAWDRQWVQCLCSGHMQRGFSFMFFWIFWNDVLCPMNAVTSRCFSLQETLLCCQVRIQWEIRLSRSHWKIKEIKIVFSIKYFCVGAARVQKAQIKLLSLMLHSALQLYIFCDKAWCKIDLRWLKWLLRTASVTISVLLLWQGQLRGKCTECFGSLHIIFCCPPCRGSSFGRETG